MSHFTDIHIVKRILSHLLPIVLLATATWLPMSGEKVDSLYHIYIYGDKSHQVEAVNSLSQALHDDGITDSLYHVDANTGKKMLDATLHYLMAEYYYDKGQFEIALDEGKAAQELLDLKKPSKFTSDVLGVLSDAQYRIGDWDEALKTLLEAYKNDKKLNDNELISSDLNSLAAIYLAIEEPIMGIYFIEKAIAIERKLQRNDRLCTRLGLASELYLMNHDPDKAMAAIDEAYALDRQSGHTEKAAVRLVQKSAVLKSLSRDDEARDIINQALPVLERKGATYSLAVAHIQLAQIEQRNGNDQAAITHYKRALEESIKCGSTKLERNAEHGLWEVLRESNPNVALLHLERYAVLNDSIHAEMKSTRLKVMEITNESIEQTELAEKSQQVNNLLSWGTAVLVLMLTAMLVGLGYSWRKIKKALEIQQQAQDQRSHFFTNITNKLQTPLSIMINSGQQLVEGGRQTADERRRLGETVVTHGQNMLEMINQIIDIENARNKIEEPEYKRGNVVLFVRVLVENFMSTAREKLINLEFITPYNALTVVFPPDYIRKLIRILLCNAIKFTPQGGKITVTLENPETHLLRLIVSDNGKGIPSEEKGRIFEPFTHSSHDGDDGVGVGLDLSLVHQLVQALKGNIAVDSTLGQGTTFTIDIPLREDELSATVNVVNPKFVDQHISDDPSRNKPLVFVVYNHDDLSYYIANILGETYRLRLAHDGKEAFQNAIDMVPDLIITGLNLPVMDGVTLIEQLRSNSSTDHIPIIALTPSLSEQTRISCIQAGADAVLVEPFNSNELRLVAHHLINQRITLRERYMKNQAVASTDTQSNKMTKMSKEDTEFINKLVEVIHAQMAKDDIDIEHISGAMSMSRKQLRSRVMSITGLTPVAYVLQVRLNYARHMISTDNSPMSIIATKCGFQNLSHFSKSFKQQFGVSPLQYRKHIEEQGRNALPPK